MIYVCLAIIAIVVVSAFILTHRFRVKVSALADETEDPRLVIQALRSALKVGIAVEDGIPMLEARLFRLRIYRARVLLPKRRGGSANGVRLMRSASLSGIALHASFALCDPFATGLFTAFLAAFLPFLAEVRDFERIEILPGFAECGEFFRLEADFGFYLGHTMVNYLKGETA